MREKLFEWQWIPHRKHEGRSNAERKKTAILESNIQQEQPSGMAKTVEHAHCGKLRVFTSRPTLRMGRVRFGRSSKIKDKKS